LYLIYYADDDMFRPLWAIFRSQKCTYAGTTRDVAYGSHNPLHEPVVTSEKSP
jgi:hypothetical protein